MESSGRAGELTEYLIGVKALGRPPDYSPLEDSSVRTRAYELRRVHFGLRKEIKAARVEIHWPSGATQTLEGVKADQLLKVTEPR
jgi:hypothetical protein